MKKSEEKEDVQDITINGVCITSSMLAVLDKWQQCSEIEQSLPESHVKQMSVIQDFFCMELGFTDHDRDEIQGYISGIIHLKKDLESFIIKK